MTLLHDLTQHDTAQTAVTTQYNDLHDLTQHDTAQTVVTTQYNDLHDLTPWPYSMTLPSTIRPACPPSLSSRTRPGAKESPCLCEGPARYPDNVLAGITTGLHATYV